MMMRTSHCLLLIASAFTPINFAFAQPAATPAVAPAKIIFRPSGSLQNIDVSNVKIINPNTAVVPAASLPTVDAAAKSHKQARLKKIKATKFDRRRSAYIKAWADEGKEKPKKTEEAKKVDKAEEVKADEKPKPELTAEQKKAAEVAKKAAELAKKNTEDLKRLDEQLKKAQKDVTLGKWSDVKKFIDSLKAEKEEPKALYDQLLNSLITPPKVPGAKITTYAEKSVVNVDDFMAIVDMAPNELDFPIQQKLARLLSVSLSTGYAIEDYMKEFRAISDKEKESYKIKDPKKRPEFALDRYKIAKILSLSGNAILMKEFLNDMDAMIKQKNRSQLNLISQYYLSLHSKENKPAHLETAWNATMAALDIKLDPSNTGDVSNKNEALNRAVSLSPRVPEELGQAWLKKCFTTHLDIGKEIISNLGTNAGRNLSLQIGNNSSRLRTLKLEHTAIEALLKEAPEQAEKWKTTVQLLAENWLKEAQITRSYDYSSSRTPTLTRDVFGNYFYNQINAPTTSSSNRNIRAIRTADILDLLPSDRWLEKIPNSLRPKFLAIIPRLYLKVKEEEEAFPYIEKLATSEPEVAKELIEEFLRVWTNNHDPNTSRRYTSSYMFSYGFNVRAQGIPLTRSKQDRNLKELAKWIKRIQDLPIDDLNEDLIRNAFVRVHSSAEVYKIEDMENIFGNVDKLKPKTYASLVQTMRANLASVWRLPATQKKGKTNRKQIDIQQEVLRGYQVARDILEKGMKKYPDDWAMRLAKASLDFDSNEYQKQLADSTKYAGRKKSSLDDFEKAAKLYLKTITDADKNKYTAEPFQTWFYASMGAPDLGNLTPDKSSDPKQFPLIREAILSMDKDIAKNHMNMFANNLFTRLSSVQASMKYRFLEAGFAIVGDNERAEEARKVFDYYKDIVTEIQLETEIDGSDVVGSKEPFGVFVNIRHTKQIERESGGFSRYLQNQKGSYYYNYGRPQSNYREKFEENCKKALDERFEILSVTFETEDVHSRATAKPDWRITPYAYLLLKPRGVEVDKLPALKLDMDFQDTSGFAVLPVSSSPLPIVASKEPNKRENFESVEIVQTLDEREADAGILKMEIKVTSSGLVPELDQLLDLSPEGFIVEDIEDEGVAVSHFDKESSQPAIVSERMWLVSMKADPKLEKQPTQFQFAEPKIEAKEVTYQRFVDADLVSVEPKISLEEKYGETSYSWIYTIIGVVAVLIAIFAGYQLLNKKEEDVVETGYQLPNEITPFTVIGLLKTIHQNNGLSSDKKEELKESIVTLEKKYFENDSKETDDLVEVANRWLHQAS